MRGTRKIFRNFARTALDTRGLLWSICTVEGRSANFACGVAYLYDHNGIVWIHRKYGGILPLSLTRLERNIFLKSKVSVEWRPCSSISLSLGASTNNIAFVRANEYEYIEGSHFVQI